MLESDSGRKLAATYGPGFETSYCCGSIKKWQEGLPLSSKLICYEIRTLIFLYFQTVIDDKNNIMNYIIAKVNTNLH